MEDHVLMVMVDRLRRGSPADTARELQKIIRFIKAERDRLRAQRDALKQAVRYVNGRDQLNLKVTCNALRDADDWKRRCMDQDAMRQAVALQCEQWIKRADSHLAEAWAYRQALEEIARGHDGYTLSKAEMVMVARAAIGDDD